MVRLLFCFEEVQVEKQKQKALILNFNPSFPHPPRPVLLVRLSLKCFKGSSLQDITWLILSFSHWYLQGDAKTT